MSGDRYKIANQQGTYFLTLTVVDWIDLFTRKEYCNVIVDSLNYCINQKGLEVFAYVIMSSHVHMVCRTKEPIIYQKYFVISKNLLPNSLLS